MAKRHGHADKLLSSLGVSTKLEEALLARFDRDMFVAMIWLDTPNQLWKGQTPRQAARDDEEDVLAWLKKTT